jgi:hypothetical protein
VCLRPRKQYGDLPIVESVSLATLSMKEPLFSEGFGIIAPRRTRCLRLAIRELLQQPSFFLAPGN